MRWPLDTNCWRLTSPALRDTGVCRMPALLIEIAGAGIAKETSALKRRPVRWRRHPEDAEAVVGHQSNTDRLHHRHDTGQDAAIAHSRR